MNKPENYLSLFIKIAIVLFVVSLIFPFTVNYFFSNWSTSGTFGDTYGALNAVFSGLALAGIIVTIQIQRKELQNQKKELILQREEMKETRKEFLLNRTTSLVYNQLERFEKALSSLTIKNLEGKKHIGNDAIMFLDENKNLALFDMDDRKYRATMKKSIINLLKIYKINKPEINKFSHNIYTSVEVLKRIVYKTDLEIGHLNDLKNIFFVNIGFINMGIIERIVEINRLELEYLDTEDYITNGLDSSILSHADVFLKSVAEFYQLNLTNNNYEKNKEKWLSKLGTIEK